MKIFTNAKSGLLKAVLVLAMACPMAVSCYDDSELREQIDLIIDELAALEEKLNAEVAALQNMLRGKLMITEVSRDAATGITTVTLSNGSKLELLPEKDLKSMITYITLADGVDYWAYINGEGKKELFYDKNDKPIPVAADVPEVVVIDGDTYLVIGGVQYPLSGNSVFSDYELITDELTGDVYAVTFTFGDDMTFTVTVDGACGFHFVAPTGGFGQNVIIQDYFIANGTTDNVQIDARGVVDYVLQIPDGWRVKEIEDIYMGTRYFQVTAPKKELVESGVAAADGDLKVVAVLEGGKATVSKLFVTTEPFKAMGVSYGKADVKMYNGLQKFVYGVCPVAEYDEAAILEVAEGLLTAYEYPLGYGVSTADLAGFDLNELVENPLVAGQEYVFWALPAMYYMTADDAGYYVAEGTFENVNFVHASVQFEISNVSFRDAQLTMALDGVTSFYVDVVPAESYALEYILSDLNSPGLYEAKTSPMTYEGSVFSLTGVQGEQATAYVAWIAVAKDGEYTASDVIAVEFSTLNLTPGGNVNVTVEEENVQAVEISASLSAAGAETIYYQFLKASEAKNYADDAAKATYLFEKGKSVKAETAEVKASESVSKMAPETDYVLFAVASDPDGKYGTVLTKEYKTTALQYNDLIIDFELLVNDPGNVVLGIKSEGAEDYLYWVGKVSDNTWKSSNYLGGSAEKAQVFMYLNQTHSRLQTAMSSYPVVDGKITMTDLQMSVDYVIVAMAKDKSGLYSKAYTYFFNPRPVAIGTMVPATDAKWEAAKPAVTFLPEKFYAAAGQMPGSYAYTVVIPQGFTGYILAGTDSYLNDGNDELVMSSEDKIVKIMQMANHRRSNSVTVDYDAWGDLGYPYGHEFYHYEHGNPLFGELVIWATEEFHNSLCDCGGNHVVDKEVNDASGGKVTVQEHHLIHINDGTPVEMRQPYAIGSTTEIIDKVFVVCQDLEGNCYEPYVFDVNPEWFANAGARDE